MIHVQFHRQPPASFLEWEDVAFVGAIDFGVAVCS